jgi:hypothetical protein
MYVHVDNVIVYMPVTVSVILLTLAPRAASNSKYNCYYFCLNIQGAKASTAVFAITAIFFLMLKFMYMLIMSLLKCQ